MINRLRTWWQEQTGEEETPFDGDSSAFIASLVFHLFALVALGLTPLLVDSNQVTLTLTAPLEEEQEELELPEEVFHSELPSEKVGANSLNGTQMALSVAPVVSEISEIPNPIDLTETEVPNVKINEVIQVATGLNYNKNLAVKGAYGEGSTGASGAIDRITHEILLSLEERKTLVVWLFDQSGSLSRQRQEVLDRFDRIYEELGVIEAAGNEAFSKHKDKPLLTSVFAFGQQLNKLIEEPSDQVAEIKEAVRNIEQDDSGVENVFASIYTAAKQFTTYRMPDEKTREPERNVMLIVMTDEAGDDGQNAEEAIRWCRRYEIPVYVVGVPAPFGRQETVVKWVDPDPEYDQTPQWGRVDQGPESMMPERVQLSFSGWDEEPIDSGFGPFQLTRMAYETGGIYFAVHPNRNVNREVTRRETTAFSSHLKYFFDAQIMRRYRPDYVSANEYARRVSENAARTALLKASQMSQIDPMADPDLRFVKRSEADLANALSEAQKQAAKLEPKINRLFETLRLGEAERDQELSPRWQAGYDLAMGRVAAVKVRTEAYNAMLAQAKRGMKFEDENNNTWLLVPSDELSVGSQMTKVSEKAREYLERVVAEHPGTPWALLAERELEQPLGWKWTEEFTDLAPQGNGNAGNNNNNPAPNDDARRMLKKGPPKRKLPKL